MLGNIDKDGKEGQNRVFHKKETLWPDHHECHNGQEDTTHPHCPEVELTPPVPFWIQNRYLHRQYHSKYKIDYFNTENKTSHF